MVRYKAIHHLWALSLLIPGLGCGPVSGGYVTLATLGQKKPVGNWLYNHHFPERLILTQGDTCTFIVRDAAGNPLPTSWWKVRTGTITPSGDYQAPAEPGTDRLETRLVNGMDLGLDIQVVAAPSFVRFDITPATIAAGQSAQIRVELPKDQSAALFAKSEFSDPIGWIAVGGPSLAVPVQPNGTTTYFLRITNPAGTQKTFSATLEVK